MEIREILKNALIFPAKNLETLSIYALLLILQGVFLIEGIITIVFGLVDIINIVIGAIYLIIAIIITLITGRMSMQCIKSGIDLEEKLPDFQWFSNLGVGFKKIIITIFYFIIPALITVAIGLLTNIFGTILYLFDQIVLNIPGLVIGDSAQAMDAISVASYPLLITLAITISASLIIFLIFSFFQWQAEARLAHTGKLRSSLNFVRSIRDIKKIGLLRVVILSVYIYFIVLAFEFAIAFIFDHFIMLSVLNIIITPYIVLFSQRALGLLYSDIV